MNPVEAAALIGVGGSVIVAVVAYVATTLTTRWTLADDRQRRVWDKKSTAYELALSELIRRQTTRFKAQRDEPDIDLAAEYLAALESPDWARAEAMLLAYGVQPVIDALEDSRQAYLEAALHLGRLQETKRATPRSAYEDAITVAFRQMIHAVKDADKQDQALANAIRADLGAGHVKLPLPSRQELS
jgi:hypothetical protein